MVEFHLLLFIIYIITIVKGFPFIISIESWLKLDRNIDVNPLSLPLLLPGHY